MLIINNWAIFSIRSCSEKEQTLICPSSVFSWHPSSPWNPFQRCQREVSQRRTFTLDFSFYLNLITGPSNSRLSPLICCLPSLVWLSYSASIPCSPTSNCSKLKPCHHCTVWLVTQDCLKTDCPPSGLSLIQNPKSQGYTPWPSSWPIPKCFEVSFTLEQFPTETSWLPNDTILGPLPLGLLLRPWVSDSSFKRATSLSGFLFRTEAFLNLN